MQKKTFKDRLHYWFDNTISNGPIAIISWLAILTIVMVLISTFFVWIASADKEASFLEQIWAFSMLALEPDALTFGHWPLRVATLLIVFTSIFALSTLIGVLTTGIETKLEDLRKGRSKVVENGHTVLLGWSEHVFPIISELVIANENQKNPCIVVLGDKDKVEMEDLIRERVGDTGKTRIVCRHGDPMEMDDLQIVSVDTSKSIIILPSTINSDSDISAIKTLLAITKNPNRRSEPYHIVAAIREPRNLEVANIVGQDEVELVCIRSLISRIVAQTCRQRGLSDAYMELLDFKGDEIYFHHEPSLTGKTYQDILLAYQDSTVIGIKTPGTEATLNPDMQRVLGSKDQIIAITADDDTFHLSPAADQDINHAAINAGEPQVQTEENTLILGWNQLGPQILQDLDYYVPAGSSVSIVTDHSATGRKATQKCGQLKHQECTFQEGDTTDRELLETLSLQEFDHIILLANSDTLSPKQADAHTLMTLLHLRDIADRDGHHFAIITEVLDIRNRELAEAARVDDFIVSDRLISLVLSQISENKFLGAVFEDMLNSDGAEIYIKPASHYLHLNQEINFSTIITAASQRGETAIGYRVQADEDKRSHGVVLNPHKSDRISFTAEDSIIVLAAEGNSEK